MFGHDHRILAILVVGVAVPDLLIFERLIEGENSRFNLSVETYEVRVLGGLDDPIRQVEPANIDWREQVGISLGSHDSTIRRMVPAAVLERHQEHRFSR